VLQALGIQTETFGDSTAALDLNPAPTTSAAGQEA
jgi:hypothetical protein